MNPTELFEKLVESGIGFSITNHQLEESHPNLLHNGECEFYLHRMDDIGLWRYVEPGDFLVGTEWLGHTAAELYPQSEFAKWWRGHND